MNQIQLQVLDGSTKFKGGRKIENLKYKELEGYINDTEAILIESFTSPQMELYIQLRAAALQMKKYDVMAGYLSGVEESGEYT